MMQQEIIDALVRTIRANGDPNGMRWTDLKAKVRTETSCSPEEFDQAFLQGEDNGVLEGCVGRINIHWPEASEDQVREARERQRESEERKHDMNKQNAAEGS